MVYGPDQSNELGMLDSDNGSVSPEDILKGSYLTSGLDELAVTLEYFDCFVLILQSHTSNVYTEILTIFKILHNNPV